MLMYLLVYSLEFGYSLEFECLLVLVYLLVSLKGLPYL